MALENEIKLKLEELLKKAQDKCECGECRRREGHISDKSGLASDCAKEVIKIIQRVAAKK